jgi:hypothetical protein
MPHYAICDETGKIFKTEFASVKPAKSIEINSQILNHVIRKYKYDSSLESLVVRSDWPPTGMIEDPPDSGRLVDHAKELEDLTLKAKSIASNNADAQILNGVTVNGVRYPGDDRTIQNITAQVIAGVDGNLTGYDLSGDKIRVSLTSSEITNIFQTGLQATKAILNERDAEYDLIDSMTREELQEYTGV